MEEELENIGLQKKDALNQAKRRDGSTSDCKRNRANPAISNKGTIPNKN